MSDLVRAKLETGEQVTVGREFAAIHQLEILEHMPAVDNRGVALDAKPLRTVEEAAAASDTRTPAQKAAETRAAKKAAEASDAAAEQERADARQRAQDEADAANAAAAEQNPTSPSGDAASTEETR